MIFNEFEDERRFRKAWDAIRIVRPVRQSLFTFGDTVLSYFLVCGQSHETVPVTVTRGDVRVSRPVVIRPHNAPPEFVDFFENLEEEDAADFIIARKARFSGWKFEKKSGARQIIHEPTEAVVGKLNRQLDDQEEESVAILTSPPNLAGMAVFRYTLERMMQSAPENIQELRERGFLP